MEVGRQTRSSKDPNESDSPARDFGVFAGTLVSPKRGWIPLLGAVGVGILSVGVALALDSGFEYGVGTGVVISIGVALAAYS